MIRNKFQFKTISNIIQMDWEELKMSMLEMGFGEVIVREPIEWNTEQMRKYFHGPIRKYFVQEWRNLGVNKTVDDVKYELKKQYGARQDKSVTLKDGRTIIVEELKSTGRYDKKDYKELLLGANIEAIDKFGRGIPEPDKIE